MSKSIEEIVRLVLHALAGKPRNEAGDAGTTGQELREMTGLSPSEINDGVTILQESGLVEWRRYLGTHPFDFGHVNITPRGRHEWERARTPAGSGAISKAETRWDLFICHASEDRDEITRPLAEALREKGLKVWYDEFTLTLGDSLSEAIDYGLANSRFGIVILSPNFFRKKWTRRELDGLTAKEISYGKVILPIWHNVNREFVLKYSPTLADKFAVSTSQGMEKIVEEVLRAISKDRSLVTRLSPASLTVAAEPTLMAEPSEAVRRGPRPQIPIAKVGDVLPEVSGTHSLSLTLLWWRESDVCVNGPYIGGEYYTFAAKLGMKFIILAYKFKNNWVREQTTPHLKEGEVTTQKGYIYSVWQPLGGIRATQHSPRPATSEEVKNLIGTSGGSVKLLPEESCIGCVVFEIPTDATPIEATLFQVPVVFRFKE